MSIDIRKEKITTEDKEAIHRLCDAVVEEDLKVWHPKCTEDPNDSCLLSLFDVLLSVLGTTMSEYLNPNRPRNAFFDTNAFYLTAGGQSSIDRLAIDIEKNSVWKLMNHSMREMRTDGSDYYWQ
jgi:hypothetical protein